MGSLLRRLHTLPAPPEGLLSRFDPFLGQRSHIAAAGGLDEGIRGFLHETLSELQAAYAELRFELPSRAIHGDPHRKNLVRAGDGSIMLLDLERFSLGPPEWDLVIPVVYRQVGWYTTVDYAAFCEAYGWDVTTWAGCATLARVRRLRMTTWLVVNLG
jgi:aminoglycoside phosphotransferase (APT) family kinase protein